MNHSVIFMLLRKRCVLLYFPQSVKTIGPTRVTLTGLDLGAQTLYKYIPWESIKFLNFLFIQSKITNWVSGKYSWNFLCWVLQDYRKRPQIFDSSNKTYSGKVHFFLNLTQLPGTDDGNNNNNTTNNNNIDAICDILFIHIVSFAQWCKETKATEYSSEEDA